MSDKFKPVIKCDCIDKETKRHIVLSLGLTKDSYMSRLRHIEKMSTIPTDQKKFITHQVDKLASIIHEINKIKDCQ